MGIGKGLCPASWWLEIGGKLLHRESLRNRDFNSHFGVSPFVASVAWEKLCERGNLPIGLQHQHLLWALCWLKIYATDSVMLSILNLKSEKTFKKYRDKALNALYELENVSFVSRRKFDVAALDMNKPPVPTHPLCILSFPTD